MYYNSNKVIIQYLSYNFKCLKKLLLILGILQYRCEQRKVLDFLIEPVTDDKPQKNHRNICFERIYVSGMYMDGVCFDDKEEHLIAANGDHILNLSVVYHLLLVQ